MPTCTDPALMFYKLGLLTSKAPFHPLLMHLPAHSPPHPRLHEEQCHCRPSPEVKQAWPPQPALEACWFHTGHVLLVFLHTLPSFHTSVSDLSQLSSMKKEPAPRAHVGHVGHVPETKRLLKTLRLSWGPLPTGSLARPGSDLLVGLSIQ